MNILSNDFIISCDFLTEVIAEEIQKIKEALELWPKNR